VQTLSFVLTLPVFMMLVLFIVQVSQLMIGIAVVHYAAFAAARAASVWLPAHVPPDEPVNTVNGLASPPPAWSTPVLNYYGNSGSASWKCQKVWSAAVLACYSIAPSHVYLNPGALQSTNSNMAATTTSLYQALVPASQSNARIPMRILNKAAYASEHTMIQISGHDYDDGGPATYNPIGHPDPKVVWKPNQIGWQDPITVQVWFRFPLLTGPGRFLSPGKFLSNRLAPDDGTPDRVSNRIQIWDKNAHPNYAETLYWTQLTATATVTTEGIISIVPYVHQAEPVY